MAIKTFFISATQVKEDDIIFQNVDEKMINSVIIEQQDIKIQRILGTTLYDKMKTLIDSSGSFTGATKYKTLLDDYIQPALKRYVKAEMPYTISFQFTNKGVNKKNSENTQSVSNQQINQLVAKYLNYAEFYGQRMADFLCENSSDYPEYENPDDAVDVIHPERIAYQSPLIASRQLFDNQVDEYYHRKNWRIDHKRV